MYSTSNISHRNLFLKQETEKQHLSFPSEIEDCYELTIDWLSTLDGMDNFDASSSIKLDADDWRNTGRQFSVRLPSHSTKVYQTLLQLEESASSQKLPGILEKARLTLVDIGCGGGSASIALINLLLNYQKYKIENGLPLFPVHLNFIGIDPNSNALGIYEKFFEECMHKTEKFLIKIDKILTLPGKFSENAAAVINFLKDQDRTQTIVFTFANVVRPLENERETSNLLRKALETIGIGKFLPPKFGIETGHKELEAIQSIIQTSNIDQVIALIVAARTDTDGNPKEWNKNVQKLLASIRSQFNNHSVFIENVQTNQMKMINLRGSFHLKRGYQTSDTIEYARGFALISIRDDSRRDWEEILDADNLLLAWARVRNSLDYEMLEDTIELKLFEVDINERLSKLRDEILAYEWGTLHLSDSLCFSTPKGKHKEPRPMSLCRLEEQILATSILQINGRNYSPKSNRVFSNDLSTQKGEYLYNHWFSSYQKYKALACQFAVKNPDYTVIQTDLSNYYPSIEQSQLFRILREEIKLYDDPRTENLVEYLIHRGQERDENKSGIPQGHIASGAFSNIYLSSIDALFSPENRYNVEYYRFVDDMILIIPPDVNPDEILSILDEKLMLLGLTRSNEKTKVFTAEDFLKISEKDEQLEILGKEHNFLLSDLYKLGNSYIRLALNDWWFFVENYQKLLAGIDIYIRVPRLSRKIQQNLKWWKRFWNLWRRIPLPEIKTTSDILNINRWVTEFKSLNAKGKNNWLQRRDSLVKQLTELLLTSIESLNCNDERTRQWARIRLKFAVYRLGQLGFGEECKEIIQSLLIESPWLINPRRVCRDLALQGHTSILQEAFIQLRLKDNDEWAYVRSCILKAFSLAPQPTDEIISLLKKEAFDALTVIEKTMATESLILLRKLNPFDDAEIKRFITSSEDDYLKKNYLLLQNSDELKPDLNQKRILNYALDFKTLDTDIPLLHRYEPEVLRESFYGSEYPDGPEEFEFGPY